MKDILNKLPPVKMSVGLSLLLISILFYAIASFLRPSLHYASHDSHFNKTIPSVFAGWVEVVSTTPQVSVVSDERSLVNQLYDDMLMRTYTDSEGHQVMIALAYAKEQRQDVKVHQPDVCYPAQGYQMLKSEIVRFHTIQSKSPIVGKRQLYSGQNHMEAVSYWIRVGDETLTSGLQMRLKIIKDGLLNRRLDDGILVRVSSVISSESKAKDVYALHESFLSELASAVEAKAPGLLLPN